MSRRSYGGISPRRALIRVIFALALAIIPITATTTVSAAPAEVPAHQGCAWDAFRQHDMAGTFVSPESRMRLEVYPCGGSVIQWENRFGAHFATYTSVDRLAGGGIIATPMQAMNSGVLLDGAPSIGIKPAEPGFVQIITVSLYGELMGVYKLRKIA